MQSGLLRYVAIMALTIGLAACDKAPSTATQEQAATPTPARAATIIGKHRPDFTLVDIQGNQRSVSEWDGKVLVVNFWATWCPPCRKEMPAFIELQEQYAEQGLQFVGIAIDEKTKVVDFSDTYGVNYPMLLGTLEAIELGKKYGNRFGALPYTVIVGRDGKIAFTQRGELPRAMAEAEIKKLL